MTRLRRLLALVGAIVILGQLVIGLTPLVPWLTTPIPAGDMLQPEPAVVVFGAGSHSDATMTSAAEDRLMKAISVVQQGYAQQLLIPGSNNLWTPAARQRLRDLSLPYELVEVPSDGPVRNTHDEAVAVAQYARAHGWKRVILVTNAWHMRRSAAVFEKAGIAVLCAPCDESTYNAANPVLFFDRCTGLRCWLHEKLGYRVYRLRGWI